MSILIDLRTGHSALSRPQRGPSAVGSKGGVVAERGKRTWGTRGSGTISYSILPPLGPAAEEGTGEHSKEVLVEVSCRGLETLTLFKTKIVHFATLFKTRDLRL